MANINNFDECIFAINQIAFNAKRKDFFFLKHLFIAIFGYDMGCHIYSKFDPERPWDFWFELDMGNRERFVSFAKDKDQYLKSANALCYMATQRARSKSGKTAIHRKSPSKPTEWLVSNNNIKGSVLDYGCGMGKDVEYLKSLGYDADGYDPNSDVYGTLPSRKYDTIICNYVLNVLTPEDERSVINNIKSLLNPDGCAFVTVRDDISSDAGYFSSTGTYQRKVTLNYTRVRKVKNGYVMYMISK